MTQDQKEIYEAVEMLNDNLIELYEEKFKEDKYCFDKMPSFSFTISINEIVVEVYIPNIDTTFTIYNSINEDREFSEEENCYELFYDYAINKFRKIKEEINSIII